MATTSTSYQEPHLLILDIIKNKDRDESGQQLIAARVVSIPILTSNIKTRRHAHKGIVYYFKYEHVFWRVLVSK